LRKLLNILVLSAFIFLGINLRAYCADLSSQFVIEEIKNDIIEQLKQIYDGEIEVNIISLPYQTLSLPDGKVEIKAEIGNLDVISIIKTGIYVNNVRVKSFGARAEIKIKTKAWVAKDWIKTGETLNSIAFEQKEITSSFGSLPQKNFKPGNYMARRNIKPGEVIQIKDIQEIPTIVINSPVSLIFKTPAIAVTIPAIALTSGKTGDFIKVKSIQYKKNYVGKVIGQNLVLINI